MAEWSDLPSELLHLIANLLNSDIDVLRFRSVCTSWRSSVSYPVFYLLPNCIPLRCFSLSRRLILRLRPPEDQQSRDSSWLIKLEQDVPDMSHLLNPLTNKLLYPLPANFPKIFNSINFQIFDLGQEYVLRYTKRPCVCNPSGYGGDLYREKVAFSSNPPWSVGIDFVLMSIHISGKLVVFRSIDNSWTIIDDFTSPYDDVICYKGGLYGVDGVGRTVLVNPSLTVSEIASPIFGGDKKYLVESNGELLLVDRYLSFDLEEELVNHQDDEPRGIHNDPCIFDSTILFKVYKLNQDKQTWDELKSLGDCILFLGDNYSFSASAHDFSVCSGSSIYFSEKVFHSNEVFWGETNNICVFNLENGSIGLLMSNPGGSQLFWPPPDWISTVTI